MSMSMSVSLSVLALALWLWLWLRAICVLVWGYFVDVVHKRLETVMKKTGKRKLID